PSSATTCAQQCNHLCPAVPHLCPAVPSRNQQCCQSVPSGCASQCPAVAPAMPNSAASQYLAVPLVSVQK
ncbi:unnamed protein product, partial [Staurois parvus]